MLATPELCHKLGEEIMGIVGEVLEKIYASEFEKVLIAASKESKDVIEFSRRYIEPMYFSACGEAFIHAKMLLPQEDVFQTEMKSV